MLGDPPGASPALLSTVKGFPDHGRDDRGGEKERGVNARGEMLRDHPQCCRFIYFLSFSPPHPSPKRPIQSSIISDFRCMAPVPEMLYAYWFVCII